jgi:hypothetical protein
VKQLIDCLGKSIQVGDKVAYATTYGRSPVLKWGTITKVNESVSRCGARYSLIVSSPLNTKDVSLVYSGRILKLDPGTELPVKSSYWE